MATEDRARNVAIIMDGNARWAEKRGLSALAGHRTGAQTLERTVRHAADLGLEQLSAFAFSTENWTRPREEVDGLMLLFEEMIVSQVPKLQRNSVRLRFVGRRSGVPDSLVERMAWGESQTADNERMTLFVCFNYGGRAEIVDAATRFDGGTEEDFAACLYAPDMKDPELLIRTSGERRISNYLLWQCAYSEMAFTDTLWPDFDRAELETALSEYSERSRRFGAR